jgi:hypothetical protein
MATSTLLAQYTIPFDISGFFCLPQGILNEYRKNWNIFNMVQTCNILVSTTKAEAPGGNVPGLFYYTYATYQDKAAARNGQFLHVRRYPLSNWNNVPEN